MLVAIKKYKIYTIKTKFYRFIIKLKKLSIDPKKVKIIVARICYIGAPSHGASLIWVRGNT